MDNVNEFIMNTLYMNIKEVNVLDICNRNVVFLGTNLLSKFDGLMRKIIDVNDDFRGLIFANDAQKEHVEKVWNERLEVVSWNSSYCSAMADNERVKEFLGDNGIIIYCGSNPVNYRDVNILELGMKARRELGSHMCIYDYYQERLFEYMYIELMIKGMKLYTEINEYIYEARKVFDV